MSNLNRAQLSFMLGAYAATHEPAPAPAAAVEPDMPAMPCAPPARQEPYQITNAFFSEYGVALRMQNVFAIFHQEPGWVDDGPWPKTWKGHHIRVITYSAYNGCVYNMVRPELCALIEILRERLRHGSQRVDLTVDDIIFEQTRPACF